MQEQDDQRHRTAGPLSDAVAALCVRLTPQVSARTGAGFGEVLRRLAAPLQVAVAGRIKSGKSTLVNALIGRRVAPTDVGECTRMVTRFSYGTVDLVEVVLTDGTKQALPFDADGMIPTDLGGIEPARVSHLEVYLTNAVLRDLTVIDTPGLGSLDTDSIARTEQLLDPVSSDAVAGAEAVLYVLTQSVRADDQHALAAFAAATASREAGPANVIAVLNKADMIAPESVAGADGDVWRAAELLADRQARTLHPRVVGVLPVIGLLAESCEAGRFGAADADALRVLATLDEPTWQTMTAATDLFTTWDCPVSTASRVRLLETLDLYGIGCAVAALGKEPTLSTGDVQRLLLGTSGLAGVRDRLDAMFRARADGIKAAAALASITALAHASGDAGERQRVHDAIEVLLSKPEAHQLRLLEALTLIASGTVDLPADLVDEVLRVGGGAAGDDLGALLGLPGRPVRDLAGYALERAGWWRSFASFGATPAQSRVAHVVHRTYFLIWRRLRDGAPER